MTALQLQMYTVAFSRDSLYVNSPLLVASTRYECVAINARQGCVIAHVCCNLLSQTMLIAS